MAKRNGMICRAWITVNGERIYARDYGLRAFCFIPTNKSKGLPQMVTPAQVEAQIPQKK